MTSKGQIVDTSYSDGRGVLRYFADMLMENEAAWDARRVEDIRDDVQLAKALKHAFPQRKSRSAAEIRRLRGWYNRCRPLIFSHCYCRRGAMVARCTTRGRLISEWRGKVPPNAPAAEDS